MFACVLRLLPLLLFGLALGTPIIPQVKVREFRARIKKLSSPPHSQMAKRVPLHKVEDMLHIGAASFPVARRGKDLLIARKPDGPPVITISPGKVGTWTIKEGEVRRKVSLDFLRDDTGAWRYYSPKTPFYEIAGIEVRLVDIDCDGRYDDFDADGYTAFGSHVVCPLRKEIILGAVHVAIRSLAPDGMIMSATVAPLEGTPSQLAGLARINELRTKHGLPPVTLEPDLCRGCTLHAEYLQMNHWNGWTYPREQNLGPKGASKEGERAANRSIIHLMDSKRAVDIFWRTYYHRIDLISPALSRIGINAHPAHLSVVDVAQVNKGWKDEPWIWADPIFVPCDGATGFPCAASAETPREPVPDLGSRGTPLMVSFRSPFVKITDFCGTLVEPKNKREIPVPVLVADQWNRYHTFGIVPERPLKTQTWYRVTYSWVCEGKRGAKRINFQTE